MVFDVEIDKGARFSKICNELNITFVNGMFIVHGQQKGVDPAISAMCALEINNFDQIILVTSDSDFVASVNLIHSHFPKKMVRYIVFADLVTPQFKRRSDVPVDFV